MRSIPLFVVALSILGCSRASAQEQQLEQLAWLAGCWAAESGEAGSEEHWLPLAGGTMFGVGRTVRNGKTVQYEFLQIRLNAEGKIIYGNSAKLRAIPSSLILDRQRRSRA